MIDICRPVQLGRKLFWAGPAPPGKSFGPIQNYVGRAVPAHLRPVKFQFFGVVSRDVN